MEENNVDTQVKTEELDENLIETIKKKNIFMKKLNIIQAILVVLLLLTGYGAVYFMFAGGFGSSTYYVQFMLMCVLFIILSIAILVTGVIRFKKSSKRRNFFIICNMLAIVLIRLTEENYFTLVLDILLVASIIYHCRLERLPTSENEEEK